MEEKKFSQWQGFGFLLKKEGTPKLKKRKQKQLGRKPSKRHYVKEDEGVYLTTREAEVSWLVAKGKTVRESAGDMLVSVRTAEFYLSNVRRKLNVRSKDELLRVLFDNNFFKDISSFDEK